MIHRVFSDLSKFKNLDFHPGFNVLLSTKRVDSTDLQTRNRAGKTSFVEIVHFLMGSNVERHSIFKHPDLADVTFGMEVDIGDNSVLVERRGKSSRTIVQGTIPSSWPVQPTIWRDVPKSYSQSDWREVLGFEWFSLKSKEEKPKNSPSFRSLFSYFARRENSDGLRRPEMQSKNQQVWDQHVAVAYLLDLDWSIGAEWQRVRERENSLQELKDAAEQGILGSVISSSAQLRTELVIAKQKARTINESLRHFVVLPEYRELEKEASEISREITRLLNEQTLDREIGESIRDSINLDRPPATIDLERLYAESGVVLNGIVKRRFEEVGEFHNSIIANRKSYLESEIASVENRISERAVILERLDSRRAGLMGILRSRGALDQFQRLQEESVRLNAQIENLQQRYEAAEALEGTKSELTLSRGNLQQRLRRDLLEQKDNVDKAIATFEQISTSLYEDAGSLILDATDNGLKLDVQIQGKRSRGIQNMQVFCFDMMLMILCSDRGIGPKFLIHDSHLFDGVDERQIAKALVVGKQTADACGWQYIVTLNEDMIPESLPKDFTLKDYTLPVTLTDDDEDGGLFGFRF
jgi:uncharacterized protein YydD (DUF2326 family)